MPLGQILCIGNGAHLTSAASAIAPLLFLPRNYVYICALVHAPALLSPDGAMGANVGIRKYA